MTDRNQLLNQLLILILFNLYLLILLRKYDYKLFCIDNFACIAELIKF